jgi:hypothetical protein
MIEYFNEGMENLVEVMHILAGTPRIALDSVLF